MWKGKKIVCVIPARLGSSRLPRKILAPIAGRPLIEWVWQAASQVACFDDLTFAIDDEETAKVIEAFGGRWLMTDKGCMSGTDRLVELQRRGAVQGDIWVNWQADGPFIREKTIHDLLTTCNEEGIDVWTLKKRIDDPALIQSPDVCKVVTDCQDCALYFSRAPIPFYRKVIEGKEKVYYKHVGLYAYHERGLKAIGALAPAELELAEQLEQLRFLYNGLKVKLHETQAETLEIDTAAHLAEAERLMVNNNG
jgi:3-deoxy-manno-octulosonate cytidylyltransferase (CMP-KDO synthetase)